MHTGLFGPACPPEVRERVDAMMAAAPPAGAAAALRGRAERPDYRAGLAGLELPAFVCAGSADPWSNQAVTDELVACLRRPELVVLDGVGHLPNLEAQARFTAALRSFLRGSSRDVLAADRNISEGSYHTLDELKAVLEQRQRAEDADV